MAADMYALANQSHLVCIKWEAVQGLCCAGGLYDQVLLTPSRRPLLFQLHLLLSRCHSGAAWVVMDGAHDRKAQVEARLGCHAWVPTAAFGL